MNVLPFFLVVGPGEGSGTRSNSPSVGLTSHVQPLLGIPDNLDMLAIIPFGYPARPVGKGKKNRKPLSEVAHLERFGQTFH
jgi:hypothetical protein